MSLKLPTLAELPQHAEALPSLPAVVTYLMRSLNDESSDVDTLAHHINSDPAIVARLLAAANSVGSALSSHILTAKQAFLLLGVDRVVAIVLASSLIYRLNMHTPHFDARLLWRHSLGVATCAQVLAEHIHGDLAPDVAFTLGLLHDIGQLLMFTASPQGYVEMLHRKQAADASLCEAEVAVFGYDHAQAGRVLCEAWHLPQLIGDALAAHHAPDNSGSDYGHLTHVAEVLSHALDLGEQANNRVPALSELSCAALGLSWPKLAGRFAEIEARYENLRVALGA